MADALTPLTCTVRYEGFVTVKSSETATPGIAAVGGSPDSVGGVRDEQRLTTPFAPFPWGQVKDAYALLKKPKAARKIHPLFARGFATELNMRVRGWRRRDASQQDGQPTPTPLPCRPLWAARSPRAVSRCTCSRPTATQCPFSTTRATG